LTNTARGPVALGRVDALVVDELAQAGHADEADAGVSAAHQVGRRRQPVELLLLLGRGRSGQDPFSRSHPMRPWIQLPIATPRAGTLGTGIAEIDISA
jgi:hypothetical protein